MIANAGLLYIGQFIEMASYKLQQHLDVNVYHYTMMAKVFLPKLIKQRPMHQSAFVAISSCSALRYMPCFTHYSSTKGFASNLTLAVEKEIAANRKIELQLVVPNGTMTNIVKHPGMAWFATPTPKAVHVFLKHLENDHTHSFGTAWNEFLTKFWWGFGGDRMGPIFDFIMYHVGIVVAQ